MAENIFVVTRQLAHLFQLLLRFIAEEFKNKRILKLVQICQSYHKKDCMGVFCDSQCTVYYQILL